MAERSDQERTEDPTIRKREQASEEGRIPRSAELTTAAAMLGAAAVFNGTGSTLGSRTADLFADGLRRIGEIDSPGAAVLLLQHTGFVAVSIVALLALALGGGVFAVSAIQARGTFAAFPLTPQFSRINPIANAGKFFGWRSVADIVKSLLKVVLVGLVTWRVLGRAWPDLLDLATRDSMSVLTTIRVYIVQLLATAGGAYLALAAADYGFQYWEHVRSMRMTKDEVRQESKQSEGDQFAKSRIRAFARARIRKQMFSDVSKADVVIVNPTHLAVALRYDPIAAPAPIVLAMGERKVAERIKALAKQHGIPMIENRPLARALIASARVGMTIPAELYAAVAEVLAFVYRQRALRGQPASWSAEVN